MDDYDLQIKEDRYTSLYNRHANEFGEAVEILEKTGKVRPTPNLYTMDSIEGIAEPRDLKKDSANALLYGTDHYTFRCSSEVR